MADDLRWMSPLLRKAWCFRAEGTPPAAGDGGQAPTTGSSGQEPGHAPSPAGGTSMTLEEAQAALAAARREAAANRTRLTALEKAQLDAETAQLSELDRTKRERDAAKAEAEAIRAEARERANRYEVQLAASRLGLVDPDAAVKLLDWEALEYTDDGTPRDVDRALAKLLKDKPYLAATHAGAAPGAAPMNPATGRGNPGLTIEDVRRMTPQQAAARWPEVSKVLAGQK